MKRLLMDVELNLSIQESKCGAQTIPSRGRYLYCASYDEIKVTLNKL